MINKTKLMKKAWEIAEIGFLNTCINEYCDATDARPTRRRKLKNDTLRGKRYFVELPHVQKKLVVDFTKKAFFAEALKISWAEAKKQEKRELEAALEIIEAEHAVINKNAALEKVAETNKNAPRRELIAAGRCDVGQKLYGFIVTGLGREFTPNSDMFSLGISPDTEYVQYAYFN